MVMSFVQVRKILCLYYYYYIIVCRQNLAEICVKNFYNFFFTCTNKQTKQTNKTKSNSFIIDIHTCVCVLGICISL